MSEKKEGETVETTEEVPVVLPEVPKVDPSDDGPSPKKQKRTNAEDGEEKL
jgi:hypothetical protein